MDNDELKSLESLKIEEESVYHKLIEYVSMMADDEQKEFCRLLSEYVDVQIELEKLCSK